MGVMPAITPSLGVVSASTANPSHTATATVASASSVAVSAAGSLATTAITSSAATAVACHLLGEGLAPLPAKLLKRILSLEFVKMANLLPEAWLLEETAMEAQLCRQKGPVTDILLWVQC